MRFPLRVSIRFKIMLALLFVMTAVVTVITFTMANLFHVDKKSYISDVSALAAEHVAEMADQLLLDARVRLEAYADVLDDASLEASTRSAMLRRMAVDLPGFVLVSTSVGDQTIGTVYDRDAIALMGLQPGDVEGYVTRTELPRDALLRGELYVGNSTVSERVPTYTVAIARDRPGRPPRIVTAVLRLDRILRLAQASRAFQVFLVDGSGALIGHRDVKRIVAHDRLTELPQRTGGSFAEVKVYRHGNTQVIGGFAPTRIGGLTAVAEVPESAAYFASRELLGRLMLVSLGLLVLSAVIGLFGAETLTRSIRRLVGATRDIGQGKFDVQVRVDSMDEMGTLAESFNHMARELNSRDTALQQAQAQLIQSEKMAAFGQLGAGFAHEIKNPLAGILGLIQINLRHAEPGSVMHQGLQTMEKETKRCKAIIDNLLKFARQEKVALEPTDLGKVVEDAAAIMRHQLGIHQIQLTTQVEPGLPEIMANSNQLQQVLMNLMLNAQQAMVDQPGNVTIRVKRRGDRVRVSVEDTGPGIPKELQPRIFEPFFTTKPPGEGTGLGLSVSFGIVKDHGGDILVESEPGQGTCFLLDLPVRAAEDHRGGEPSAKAA